MNLRFKFWIEDESCITYFGEGTRRILENVRHYGSISRTADEMKMSYRQAWGHIRKAEERLGRKLVFSERGGKGGGKTGLTPDGDRLLKQLEEFKYRSQQALQEIYEEVFKA